MGIIVIGCIVGQVLMLSVQLQIYTSHKYTLVHSFGVVSAITLPFNLTVVLAC